MWIFDPSQLPTLRKEIGDYAMGAVKIHLPNCLNGSSSYTLNRDELPDLQSIPEFWEGMKNRFPILSAIAADAIWMPVVSVDVECSNTNTY